MSSLVYDTYVKMPSLTPEEEREYFKLYREENNMDARDLLIIGQMSWLAKAVREKYWYNLAVPFDDLLQEGAMMVIKLIDGSYDYTKCERFKFYARKVILGEIAIYYNKFASPTSVPKEAIEDAAKLKKVKKQLEEELGHEPSLCELAEAYNEGREKQTTKKRIVALLDLKKPRKELTYVNSDGEEVELELVDNSFEESLESKMQAEIITPEFLDACGLTKLQKYVLVAYYGLFDEPRLNTVEIAAKLERSKTAISDRLKEAREKVKVGILNLRANKKLEEFTPKERANKVNKDSAKRVLDYLKHLSDDELKSFLVENLTEKEKDYIIRRYGLLGHQKQTVVEICQELNVSRPAVYEPINKGIAKLFSKING